MSPSIENGSVLMVNGIFRIGGGKAINFCDAKLLSLLGVLCRNQCDYYVTHKTDRVYRS